MAIGTKVGLVALEAFIRPYFFDYHEMDTFPVNSLFFGFYTRELLMMAGLAKVSLGAIWIVAALAHSRPLFGGHFEMYMAPGWWRVIVFGVDCRTFRDIMRHGYAFMASCRTIGESIGGSPCLRVAGEAGVEIFHGYDAVAFGTDTPCHSVNIAMVIFTHSRLSVP